MVISEGINITLDCGDDFNDVLTQRRLYLARLTWLYYVLHGISLEIRSFSYISKRIVPTHNIHRYI